MLEILVSVFNTICFRVFYVVVYDSSSNSVLLILLFRL